MRELMTFEVCLDTVQNWGQGGGGGGHERGTSQVQALLPQKHRAVMQALAIWKRTLSPGSPAAAGQGTGAPRGRPGQVLKPSSLSSTRGNTADWGLGEACSTCSREML